LKKKTRTIKFILKNPDDINHRDFLLVVDVQENMILFKILRQKLFNRLALIAHN